MKEMSELMNGLFENKQKAPPHELSATVDEIKKVLKFNDKDKYGYAYWLSVVKRSKIRYNEIFGILKEVEQADIKYNKGGMITNKLLKKCK